MAETLLEYGQLAVLGDNDQEELVAGLRNLSGQLGYDFWGPVLRALVNRGPGLYRSSPPKPESTRELCVLGRFEEFGPAADVVVVDGQGSHYPTLSDEQRSSLYESVGFTQVTDHLELTTVVAVDLCGAVGKVKQLRKETLISKGTRRVDLWETYFSRLAQSSAEVNIFDRYLLSGLKRQQRGRSRRIEYLSWFLNQLNRDLPTGSVVNLYAYPLEKLREPNSRPRTGADKEDEGARRFSTKEISMEIDLHGDWTPNRLHLYLSTGLAHDRHIRFSCGLAIQPLQGLDRLSFSEEGLDEPFSYSFVPGGESIDHLSDAEENARGSAEHSVWRSRRVGFEFVSTPTRPPALEARGGRSRR